MSFRLSVAKNAARVALVFLPAVICGLLVAKNAVDVPVHDDWNRGAMLQHQADGELSLEELIVSEPGHGRPIVQRLLILGFQKIAGSDMRWEIAVSFLCFLVAGSGIYLLLRHTLPRGRWRLLTGFAISVALFNPLQFPNFLWASQMGFALAIACLTTGLVVLHSSMSSGKRALLAFFIAIIGMHCHPFGIMIWPAALLVVLFGGANFPVGSRVSLVIVSVPWLMLFVTQITGGGIEWSKDGHSMMAALGSPLARVFSSDAVHAAPWLGIATIILFALTAASGVRRREDRQAVLPWVGLGCAGIFGLILLGVGANDSLESRHLGDTLLVPIAIIVLSAHRLRRWVTSSPAADEETDPLAFRSAVCTTLAGVAIAVWIPDWVDGARRMEQWRSARLQAKAQLMFLPHQRPQFVGRLDKDMTRVDNYAPLLGHSGLEELSLYAFELDEKRMRKSDLKNAAIRTANAKNYSLYVRGHAILPDDKRAADGVLITWRKKKIDRWQTLKMVEPLGQAVPEMAFRDLTFGRGPNLSNPWQYSKWSTNHDWQDMPSGKFWVRAWALDVDRMKAYPLAGETQLRHDGQGEAVPVEEEPATEEVSS